MAGRKPLELAHVDALDGSERAKERLRVFLETLRGELSVPEACQRLGLHESYFHELRHRWLQDALTLLEPQPVGRPVQKPPREEPPELARENARLAAEAEALREELCASQVREEITRIKSAPPDPVARGAPLGAGKKTK
jgi:transposase-like protein